MTTGPVEWALTGFLLLLAAGGVLLLVAMFNLGLVEPDPHDEDDEDDEDEAA